MSIHNSFHIFLTVNFVPALVVLDWRINALIDSGYVNQPNLPDLNYCDLTKFNLT